MLCDNDAPAQLSAHDVEDLRSKGVHVCQWETGNSTERQLFHDLPWRHIPDLLTTISRNHDTLELATIIDVIRTAPGGDQQDLAARGGPDDINDAPAQLSAHDVEDLRSKGVHVCQWETGNSTERQLFHDLPWRHIPDLLTTISRNHDTLELATIIVGQRCYATMTRPLS